MHSIIPGSRSVEALVVVGLITALAAFGVLAWRLRRQPAGGSDGHLVSGLALAIAVAIVVALTLLTPRSPGEGLQIKLIPFEDLIDVLDGEGSVRLAVAELIGNVLLFVPLGMALRWRFPSLGIARVTIVAMLVSVAVETLQAVLATGRWATTADVITNTVGGLIGAIAGGIWLGRSQEP